MVDLLETTVTIETETTALNKTITNCQIETTNTWIRNVRCCLLFVFISVHFTKWFDGDDDSYIKVEDNGGGRRTTQVTTRKRGMTNIKRNKHFNYCNKRPEYGRRWCYNVNGTNNQTRMKEEKKITHFDGIPPTQQRHTDTLTVDRSKAINRGTQRQQSTT